MNALQQKFELGQTVTTPGASEKLNTEDVFEALRRHQAGDWGDLPEEDKEMNEQAVENGQRIFSRYEDRDSTLFYVITEADRSVTTVLLPEEY